MPYYRIIGYITKKRGLLPAKKFRFPHLSPIGKLGCKSLLPMPVHSYKSKLRMNPTTVCRKNK